MRVVMRNERVNGRRAFLQRVEDGVLQMLASPFREEVLHGMDRRGRCGREVKVPARMIRQPLPDRGRLVRGHIVQNDMNVHIGVQAFGDMIKEGHEVLGAVPLGGLANHAPGGTMADIVMGAGGRVMITSMLESPQTLVNNIVHTVKKT